jgi:pyruvate ferredoxin oxidoreductase delta subunit
VRLDEEGYYQVDLDYCKGCGLCGRQCPTACITMEEEIKPLPWQSR